MCVAIHDTIIEKHICTSGWAVSNLLPSKEAGRVSNPSGSSPSSSKAGDGVGGYAQILIVIPTDVPDKFAAIMSGWVTPEEVAGELIRW